MKREIKFRGKRVDNGEWIEGDLCNFLGGNGKCIMPKPYYATRDFGEETEQGLPVIDEGIAMGAFYPVPPETVGQYVSTYGNKQYWEGDIAKTASGIGKIVFFETYGSFMVEMPDGTLEGIERIIEILGNVTDNPELLK